MKEIILSKYTTCKICSNYLSDQCVPCLTESNTTKFEIRQDLSIDDLPPFPSVEFNNGMPVKMRQAIVGAYVEKIVERLQEGRWTTGL